MDQTLQLIAHFQSSSIASNNGTKFGQILFMKIHLIIPQSLNPLTAFQGLGHQGCVRNN